MFTVKGGVLSERFSFVVSGRAEAYFCGGYAFISPLHGDAEAYTLDGARVRVFMESGFLAEVYEMRGFIVAGYVSSSSERYSFLLKGDTLETMAFMPGLLGELDPYTLVLDDNNGNLRAKRLLDTEELIGLAAERLNGRALTADELLRFKAG